MPRKLNVMPQGYHPAPRNTLKNPAPQSDEDAKTVGEDANFDNGVSSKQGRRNYVRATGKTASGAQLS